MVEFLIGGLVRWWRNFFRSKSGCDLGKYCPVSFTSACCKIMERIITMELVTCHEATNWLFLDSLGFVKVCLLRYSCCLFIRRLQLMLTVQELLIECSLILKCF